MRFNPFRRKKSRSRSSDSSGGLSLYAKKAIAGVLLLIFSLIALLSLFGKAGPTGEVVLALMRRLFGWLGYGMPLVLLFLAGYLLWPQRVRMERTRVIGLALSLMGLAGLMHTTMVSLDDALQAANDGKAGGYLGFMLSFPLGQALGRWATGLIYLGSLMIGLILGFKLSWEEVWDKWTEILRGWGEKSEAADDGEVPAAGGVLPRFSINSVSPHEEAVPEGRVKSEDNPKPLVSHMAGRRYRPAILKVLHSSPVNLNRNKSAENTNRETIRRTLENFGIKVEMAGANVGPTVTQYTLRPEEGTKLARITALQDDLALALAAHPIRIEAPIPNKDLVGIEIPNKSPTMVGLRDLLSSAEFKQNDSPLAFPLGKDVSGKVVVDTLERLPHLLIAGATGSGKSVNIHTLLISWLSRNSPDAVRLIMVDPKRVELTPYTGIPHLLAPVIVDTEKTVNALKWCLEEMDVRYHLLQESGARNMRSFNTNNPGEARPYIVVVIDELADLMMKHAREIEGPVVRLSQMARAVGIHLVLATQRPSVNVLTGLIKANVPARIAFSVASQVDSRTILDRAGAEKLVGSGDMLYLAGDKAQPIRIQGGFVAEDEVREVVKLVKEAAGEPAYNEEVTSAAVREGGYGGGSGGDDPLFIEAKNLVIKTRKASASYLQRRLKVGYARAARILDMLEESGVVGAAEGNKPRPVLVREGEGDNIKEDDEVMEDDELDKREEDDDKSERLW